MTRIPGFVWSLFGIATLMFLLSGAWLPVHGGF